MSELSYTGGCLCGAVKYKLTGKEDNIRGVTVCHCHQCRRWSGHHWASIHGPMNGLSIVKGEDQLCWFRSSGKARRGFCKICGSALFWQGIGNKALKNRVDVSAGSLDTAAPFTVNRHIFCESKGEYYELKDGVPIYDASPEA